MNVAELAPALLSAAHDLEAAQDELEHLTVEAAQKEQRYKMAKATKYVQTEGTVAEREAAVDLSISDVRYEAHLAEGLKAAALEAVRNRRQIVSAYQTLASLAKSEAEFARVDPRSNAA